MSIRSRIEPVIQEIAAHQQMQLAPLTDDLLLLDSGLDSLCFAILVARLEDILGVDPFSASQEAYFPETFGDFVQAYQRALAEADDITAGSGPSQEQSVNTVPGLSKH